MLVTASCSDLLQCARDTLSRPLRSVRDTGLLLFNKQETVMTRLLPLLALIACTGTSKEDSSDSADTDVISIPFLLGFYDGLTGSAISGAEVCTVFPETDTPCQTTDVAGLLEWSWETSEFTNILNRLTHDDYMTALYAGRYEQDVHDGWMTTLETQDAVEISFWAFKPSNVDAYLSTGDLVAEDGQGHIVYWLVSSDESPVNGAVITLENSAGESVGQVAYQAALSNTIDTDLTATSAAGIVAIANVPPGEHTLRVSHETLTCEPGFAFSSGAVNVTTVPVEANSQTLGNLFCYTP